MRTRPAEMLVIGDDAIEGWEAYDLPFAGKDIYVRREKHTMNFRASYETAEVEIHGEPANDPEVAVFKLFDSNHYAQRMFFHQQLEEQRRKLEKIDAAWELPTSSYSM